MTISKITTPAETVPPNSRASHNLTAPKETIAVIIPPNTPGIIGRIKTTFNSTVESMIASANQLVDRARSLAGRVKEFALSLTDLKVEMTTTKIEQITLIGFAIYMGLSGKALAGGLIPTTFIQWSYAVPFHTASLASLLFAATLVDYDSPEILEKVRKKALKMPLKDVVDKHGWKNLFIHQILSPAQFQQAFKNLASTLTFKELFQFTKEAMMELSLAKSSSNGTHFQIPDLAEWIDTFHQETSNLELSEILGEYSLVDLQAMNALPPNEMHIFERTQELLSELNDHKEIVRKKLNDHKKQVEKTVSEIDGAFDLNGSLKEEVLTLIDGLNKTGVEILEKNQNRVIEIGKELSEITASYNLLRSSRPSNA